MSKIFNVEGPVFTFFSKLSDICILNFLWVITSIPVLTIGASTTALIRTMIKVVIRGEGHVVSVYFSSFKSNFKKSTIMWIIMAALGALLGFDIYFWSDVDGTAGFIIACLNIAILIPYIMSLLYVFALQGFFLNTIRNTFLNSILMAYRHFGQTLKLAIIIVIAYFINQTIVLMNLITLVIGIGFIAYLFAGIYINVFSNYVKNEAEEAIPDEVEINEE